MSNIEMYSVELSDAPSIPGEGKPRRHPLALPSLVSSLGTSTDTIYATFHTAVEKYPKNKFLGHRPIVDGKALEYEWETYEEVAGRIHDLASGLATLNEFCEGTRAGLYSINRPEWIISEQACYSRNWITVPLYDTLGKEAIEYICSQTEMPILFASADRATNILKIGPKSLRKIIVFDAIMEDLNNLAKEKKVELITMKELEESGRANPKEDTPPKPEDLLTICYTSGATGMPKGVMLTHATFVATAAGAIAAMKRDDATPTSDQKQYFLELKDTDVHLSYLPLAHVFERIVSNVWIVAGAAIGFYQGDPLKLLDDVEALNPTLFLTVPRVCNRIYDKVRAKISAKNGIVQWLFNHAYASKLKALRENNTYTHWFWDRLVFGSIRAKLGSRLRFIISGSAPLAPEVTEFMRICFSCEVYEGYGQTETTGGSSVSAFGDWSVSGHVGTPLPCVEFKLVDIPDMGYTSKDLPDPRGEICIRGPACFSGYYKDQEKTRETIDSEGWVHTGDVGRWDNQGRLYIIDRKKHLFKLAQGEYIAPERVENVLLRSDFISQAFIYGNSLENATIAIIVPNSDRLLSWARSQRLKSEDINELCKDQKVKSLYATELESFGKTGSRLLTGIELPRAILLESSPFSIENSLLTSTFKIKRADVTRKYKDILEQLYTYARQQDSQTVYVMNTQ